MIKNKIITLLRVIFGKRPLVIQKKVNVVQLTSNELLNGAVVTGGSSGIGLEIAKAMLNSGATVIITGRNKEKLEAVVSSFKSNSRNNNSIDYIQLDSTDVKSFPDKLNMILGKVKHIDILVNNAGTRGECKSEFGKAEEWDYETIMNTNLKGTFFFSQVIARYMKDNNIHGNILNIASSSSLRPANSAYILSKWGLRGLTLGMAKALIPYGIVVNAIAPGPTATRMLNKSDEDVHFPQNPSGRLVAPEEIANMAVIMTSQMGRMAVGNILYMTGGSGLITLDDAIYDF